MPLGTALTGLADMKHVLRLVKVIAVVVSLPIAIPLGLGQWLLSIGGAGFRNMSLLLLAFCSAPRSTESHSWFTYLLPLIPLQFLVRDFYFWFRGYGPHVRLSQSDKAQLKTHVVSLLEHRPLPHTRDTFTDIASDLSAQYIAQCKEDGRKVSRAYAIPYFVRELLTEIACEHQANFNHDASETAREPVLYSLVNRFAGSVKFDTPTPQDATRLKTASKIAAAVATFSVVCATAAMCGVILPAYPTFVSCIAAGLILMLRDWVVRCEHVFRTSSILKHDHRKPILVLRSFDSYDERSLIGNTEEILWKRLSIYGPVVAVARPGVQSKMAGAIQIQVDNEVWQSFVLELVAMAQLIVLRIGKTQGIEWELNALHEGGHMERLVLYLSDAPQLAAFAGRDREAFDAWVELQNECIRSHLRKANMCWYIYFKKSDSGELVAQEVYTGTDKASFESATVELANAKLLPCYEPAGNNYERRSVAAITDNTLTLMAALLIAATVAYRLVLSAF